MPDLFRVAAMANPTTGPVWDLLPKQPKVTGAEIAPARPAYLSLSGTLGAGGTVTVASSYDGTTFTTYAALTALQDPTLLTINRRFWRASVTAGDGTTSLSVSLVLGSDELP